MVFIPAAFRSVPNRATASLYALKAPMKPVITRYTIMGEIMGRVILVKVLNREVPSTRAAL